MSSWSVEPPDLGRAGREEKDVGRRQDISTLATTTAAAAAAGTGASIHTHTQTRTQGPFCVMALRTFLRWFVRSPFLLPQQRSTIVVGLSKMIFCCWTGVPHQAIPSGNMSEYTTEGTEGAKKQQKEGAKQKYDQQREREGSHTRIGDDGMAWQGTGNGGRTGTRCG